MSRRQIGIAIWDGVEELDFAGPFEVLTAWGAADVLTIAASREPIRCAHGLRVLPDRAWDEVEELDVFVLPGGRSGPLLEDETFLARVRGLAASGALMTSVCTGALVFARAGLLDGSPATTHWSALERLAALGHDVEVRPEARFVDNGSVVTAAGVSAGIDMALHLVARLDSVEKAREVRRYIQYEPQPPV